MEIISILNNNIKYFTNIIIYDFFLIRGATFAFIFAFGKCVKEYRKVHIFIFFLSYITCVYYHILYIKLTVCKKTTKK